MAEMSAIYLFAQPYIFYMYFYMEWMHSKQTITSVSLYS